MSGGEPIAAPARILRDERLLLRHLPRVLASADDLLTFHRMHPDEARRALDARLGALRARLGASPWWGERLRSLSLSPADLGSLDDLPGFPTIGRGDIGERWVDLLGFESAGRGGEAGGGSSGAPDWGADAEADGIVAVRSSGSTGEPITVPKDSYDAVHMWAALRFWCRALGVVLPPRPRVALLCALPGGLEYVADLPLFDDGHLERIATVRPRAAERLSAFAPDVLFSDPAGLHWLESAAPHVAPRIILSSAQHLPEEQYLRLSGSCPVVDYYATSEVGPIAWRCPTHRGALHVMHPDVWVQSVDGELVVTRLRDSALPLLRLRTGDSGDVDADGCPCGAGGAVIRNFQGRRQCWFHRPDGGRADAWQLAWIFKGFALADFRLTQIAPAGFLLEVAGHPTGLAELSARLERALVVMGWVAPIVSATTTARIAVVGSKPEPFRSQPWAGRREA